MKIDISCVGMLHSLYNMNLFPGSSENIETAQELKTLSNVETNQPNTLAFPKRVFFIIANEFCEQYNFVGMNGKVGVNTVFLC